MRDFNQTPAVVIWEVTQACALACVHCRAEARAWRDPNELSTEEGRSLILHIASLDKPLLVLTGGDPMERPDLPELVAEGVASGLSVGLSPSATAKVTRDGIESLKKAGLHRVAVSLDSHDSIPHDKFRGVAGSFKRTMDIAAWAREMNLPLQIGTTITRHNMHDLEKMAELVERLGVILWSVFFLVPTGRAIRQTGATPSGDGVVDQGQVSAEESEDLLQRLAGISRRARFAIKTTEAPHYRRIVWQAKGDVVPNIPGVNDAKGFVFISHTGDVYPSGFLPIKGGNVRQSPLGKIYRNAEIFQNLRDPDKLKGRCGACEYKKLCGGSRARAYAMTGDPLAEDPLCGYIPAAAGRIV